MDYSILYYEEYIDLMAEVMQNRIDQKVLKHRVLKQIYLFENRKLYLDCLFFWLWKEINHYTDRVFRCVS